MFEPLVLNWSKHNKPFDKLKANERLKSHKAESMTHDVDF